MSGRKLHGVNGAPPTTAPLMAMTQPSRTSAQLSSQGT